MAIATQAKQLTFKVVGLIGESSDFFRVPTHDVQSIFLDMEKATYMNSVGVKHWVLWTTKVPKQVKVTLSKCPFMVANQASTVNGFMPSSFQFESFFAPFVCPDCENETMILLQRGIHFEYQNETAQSWVKLPVVKCQKCKNTPELEPDFFTDKVFSCLKEKT